MSASAELARGRSESGEFSWRAKTALAVVLVVLLAAISIAVIVTTPRSAESSPEAGFARDMSVHHAQAVEISLIARDRTQDPDIRTLATDILLTQQFQIGQMQGWLDGWKLLPTGRDPPMAWMGHAMMGPLMPGMATPEAIAALPALTPQELDVEFLRMMIRHHTSAVAMANAALARARLPEVRRLAEAIVASQRAEIALMQDLLVKKGQPRLDVSFP